jgi:hypothetical protein
MKNLLILATAFIPLVGCGASGLPKELRASAEIQKVASEAEIPETVTYTQIYTTADQETHFRNVTVKLISTAIPPTQPVGFSAEETATTIVFASFPAHWGDCDRENNILHTPSSRRFISLIQGNIGSRQAMVRLDDLNRGTWWRHWTILHPRATSPGSVENQLSPYSQIIPRDNLKRRRSSCI